jgi:hypothetical protein
MDSENQVVSVVSDQETRDLSANYVEENTETQVDTPSQEIVVNDENMNEPSKSMFENMFSYTKIMNYIEEKKNDQDFMQKVNVSLTVIFEIYRVLMGAFLTLFIPQKCDDDVCSLSQNANRDDVLSRLGVSLNSLTMLSFLYLYYIEVKRENKLINYLEVNRFTPVDNESVGDALEKLDQERKDKIWNYDKYYQTSGFISTYVFGANAIISSVVVYSHYLDSKTVTVYLTNLLFLGMKVSDVYNTVNTKKNVFYSAYLKNKVQFNDVDPDKLAVKNNM